MSNESTEQPAGLTQWRAERLRAGDNVLAEDTERSARAKPLNAATLAAIPTGLRIWDDQIEYLADIIGNPDFAGSSETYRTRIRRTHDDLVRAREWLASVVATRSGP